ncbi:acyltransferase family protein [Qipengyuania seohaensis]|uniref:acyltransferase family protein n=1 Tax=Qipengyuania seohaensis TaxID=266951 RepID=UPI000C22733F|nr:acyltransferase [Qipengyuania seohaensis]
MVALKNAHAIGARYAFVDSIRGIAALMVIYLHIAEQLLQSREYYSDLEISLFTLFTAYFDAGKIGVIMFFAVSGYVIPFSLLKKRKRPLLSFAIGRFMRLYPAYWLSILAMVLVVAWQGNPFDSFTIAANATMLQGFVGIQNIQGLYWTLQIELVFYGLCVVLFFFGLLGSQKWVTATAIATLAGAFALAVARWATGMGFPVALPLALFAMFIGMTWRTATLDKDETSMRHFRLLIALFVISIPLISLLAYNADAANNETWYRYTLSYFTAMGLFILMTSWWKISNPFLSFLGTISYSVYLFGWVCTQIIETAFPSVLTGAIPGHALIALASIMTIVVSTAIYYLVEKPSIELGRKLVKLVENGKGRAQISEVI